MKHRAASSLLAVLLAGLGGCAHPALLDPGPVFDEPTAGEQMLADAVEQNRAADAEPPDDVKDALLPPLQGPWLELEDEPRFDVSVNRAPAAEFFMSLVEGTPYNVVVHPDVKGAITLHLKSVTISEVMETVQQVYGYAYRQAGGVFVVSPADLQTRVFEIDYLHVRRQGESQIRVTSGQISERDGGVHTAGTPRRRRAESDPDGLGRSSASGSLITTVSEADLWADLQRSVSEMLGQREGRSVVVNANSGIVVVRALPNELREIELYLRSVQESLRRQVILEAKILEVSLDDGFRSGVNWSGLVERGASSYLGTQTGGGTALADGVSEIAGNTGVLDPSAVSFPQSSETSAFGGVFAATIQTDDFTAFIELLETQGETQVLSSPRVSTLNNQKAVIKVGSDEFFVTDVSTTTVTGTTTTTNPTVTLTPFFSGIALDVTPQIDPKGYVTLHIHPSVSQVEDQTKTITIGDDILSLPLAFSTIRETDSVVRVRDGQVVVIGGLMQDNLRDRRASTPFLSKLPLLSSLFEQNDERALKRELVILLRVRIVGPGVWQRALEDSADRLQRFREQQHRGGRP